MRVINDGIPGQNSAEVDARIGVSLKKYHPGVVVLFAGMNDAVNEQKFLAPEITEQHMRSMIQQSKQSGAKVVLVSVHEPDITRLLQRHSIEAYGAVPPRERIEFLDRILALLAEKESVQFANFHRALQKAGGATTALSPDGVHLNAKGYALLASVVRNAMPAYVPNNTTILCIGDSLTYGIGVRRKDQMDQGQNTYPAQLEGLLRQSQR